MARPTKLTPETQGKIVQAISAGNYYEAACMFAGIDYQTFRNWMKAGEETKNGTRKKTKTNKRYLEFFEAVKQAEAQAEVRAVAQWQKAMPDSWQAARDFLARRHPQRWMPREAKEISGKDGKRLDIGVTSVDYRTAIAPLAPGSMDDSATPSEDEDTLDGEKVG